MAFIRPKNLPLVASPTAGDVVIIDGATTRSILVNNLIAPPPTSIALAQSPYTVLLTDAVLYVDTSAGAVTINLPAAAARNGLPISVKDISGNAATAGRNITIVPNGAETIESLASIKVNANYGGFRLYPATGKYVIAP